MNKTYKKNFIKAGRLAGQVRAFGKELIVKGASYQDILKKITAKIKELGAIPAFPPQIALNQVAAHFIFAPSEDLIFSDEVVKLDIGVCYEGAIGDCAVTVDLSGQYGKLVEAAEAALFQAEKSIVVGKKICEIGGIINDTIQAYGFQPIKNLCGHSLGLYKVHTSPLFPNYNDRSHGIIRPGMTFAIEPFATTGQGLIKEEGEATIFSFNSPRLVTSPSAKALLTKIRQLKNLPFGYSEILENLENYTLIKKDVIYLMEKGVLDGYAPLVEVKGGMVAQAENSFLVDEEGQVHVTTKLPLN